MATTDAENKSQHCESAIAEQGTSRCHLPNVRSTFDSGQWSRFVVRQESQLPHQAP